MPTELLYKEEVYKIIGACLEVYNVMGSGFLEAVYQECLRREFDLRGIPYVEHKRLQLDFKGIRLDTEYESDFECYGKIILEIKAASKLNDGFRAQTLNYLNATKHKVGLLVNFGHHKTFEWERFVLTEDVDF
ncbi:MAG: GxxExxY protein [Kiritimatiellae bacterium]|nr:GxxExxY protein [Kiritimatiellia bacterium]